MAGEERVILAQKTFIAARKIEIKVPAIFPRHTDEWTFRGFWRSFEEHFKGYQDPFDHIYKGCSEKRMQCIFLEALKSVEYNEGIYKI
jgi:hypothetical protein